MELLLHLQWAIFVYYVVINLFYLFQFFFASVGLYNRYQEAQAEDIEMVLKSDSLAAISFILSSFNEEETIVDSLRVLLAMNYRSKQVIIVNDGSTDHTLATLTQELRLVEVPIYFEQSINTQQIKAVYISNRYRDVIVIDKINGGKADAMNAGLNAATNPIVVAMDSDTLIDGSALNLLIRPFLQEPSIMASGAGVRVGNGCRLTSHHISSFDLPSNFLAACQTVEYIRDFFLGRLGWETMGPGNLIISGAFGLFKRDALLAVGGWTSNSLTEDLELILNIHHHFLDQGINYQVAFTPDPVAWTEVPETLKTLGRQRVRWYRGLIYSLWKHKEMWFNPRYGWKGLVVIPFFLFSEILGPLVELAGVIIILLSYFLGILNQELFFLLICASIGFGTLLTTASTFYEAVAYQRLSKMSDQTKLIILAIIENFGYHQLTVYWRLKAIFQLLSRRRKEWGMMPRVGFRGKYGGPPTNRRFY